MVDRSGLHPEKDHPADPRMKSFAQSPTDPGMCVMTATGPVADASTLWSGGTPDVTLANMVAASRHVITAPVREVLFAELRGLGRGQGAINGKHRPVLSVFSFPRPRLLTYLPLTITSMGGYPLPPPTAEYPENPHERQRVREAFRGISCSAPSDLQHVAQMLT